MNLLTTSNINCALSRCHTPLTWISCLITVSQSVFILCQIQIWFLSDPALTVSFVEKESFKSTPEIREGVHLNQ